MKLKIIVSVIVVLAIAIAVIVSAPFSLNISFAYSVFTNPYSVGLILVAILVQLVAHWIRAIKHQTILEQVRPVKVVEIFKGQAIGSLFNSILPLRLGELVRAHYIARGVSISRSAVFATILFERFIDVFFLLFAGVILLLFLSPQNANMFGTTLIVLTVGGLILGFILYSARSQQTWLLKLVFHFSRLFNNEVRNRIRMIAWSAIYILKHAITKKIMPRYIRLTVVMWILYFTATFIFALALLNNVTITDYIKTALAAYFGTSIPSGPAYLGSFQDIFTKFSGLPEAFLHTHNITFFLWLFLIVPVGLLGLYFLLRPQKKYYVEDEDKIVSAFRNKLFREVDITNEFAHFLDAYFRGSEINKILTTQELLNNFQVIKTFKGGSNALTLLAWQEDHMVVKKITLKQYRDKLKAQFDWLNTYKKHPQITKVLNDYDTADYYALDIEYRDNFITYFDFIHSSSTRASVGVLTSVIDFVEKTLYRPVKRLSRGNKALLNDYIESKVVGKVVDAASMNLNISNLLGYETISINGKYYKNFNVIIKELTSHKEALKDLTQILESPIHGDLTVDNIIVNPANNEFIILDPNNENFISDATVDYGKLMQSVHSGYEFLCTLNSCRIQQNAINFEESRSAQYDKLFEKLTETLQEKLSPARYRSVLFHEAVHYCRMLTYRCDINPETAAVFYAIAVRLFNEYLRQYEKV